MGAGYLGISISVRVRGELLKVLPKKNHVLIHFMIISMTYRVLKEFLVHNTLRRVRSMFLSLLTSSQLFPLNSHADITLLIFTVVGYLANRQSVKGSKKRV